MDWYRFRMLESQYISDEELTHAFRIGCGMACVHKNKQLTDEMVDALYTEIGGEG